MSISKVSLASHNFEVEQIRDRIFHYAAILWLPYNSSVNRNKNEQEQVLYQVRVTNALHIQKYL